MDQAAFSMRTVDEAAQLASFVAHACPVPDAAIMGISELLINGIEHGNLGLTYSEKSALKLSDKWQDEIEHRSKLPENINKRVHLSFKRSDQGIELVVRDEGQGFDWQ